MLLASTLRKLEKIGDHTDTVGLGFEGQPFTVMNGSVTNARTSACWEMPCS